MSLPSVMASVPSVFVDLFLVAIGLVALSCFSIAAGELRTAHRVFSTPIGRVSDLLTDPEGPSSFTGRHAPPTRRSPDRSPGRDA